MYFNISDGRLKIAYQIKPIHLDTIVITRDARNMEIFAQEDGNVQMMKTSQKDTDVKDLHRLDEKNNKYLHLKFYINKEI